MVKAFQNKKIYLILAICVLAVILFFWRFKTEKISTICGNGRCETRENCWNCGIDCKCGKEEYCSFKDKKCLKLVCGNGICEPFEDSENCCLDCQCPLLSLACNEETKKCEAKKIKLSDEKALQLTNQYFRNLGKEVKKSEVLGIGVSFDKLIKKVRVQTTDGQIEYLGITEEEEIFTLPAF